MAIISHITLGTNDVARAAEFYDAVMPLLGFTRLDKPADFPLAYAHPEGPTLFVYLPYDEHPATVGNGTHIAFTASNCDTVHSFYETALKQGGTCEGSPGPRPQYGDNYYAAYVRDPDGNKLQAVCYTNRDPK